MSSGIEDNLGYAIQWHGRKHVLACVNACAGLNPEAIPALMEALADCTLTSQAARALAAVKGTK